MSRIFTLGAIAGSGGSRYWYGGIQGTSTTTVFPFDRGLAVGPNDEFLICAFDESITGNDSIIYKISSKGRLSWQKNVSGVTSLSGIDISPSGSSFAVGAVQASLTNQFIYAPFTGDPTASTWARTITSPAGGFSSSHTYPVRALIDSSENVYIVSSHNPVNSANIVQGCRIVKYNSSGVLQWGRSIYSATADYMVNINDACLDINNDVIIAGMALEIAAGTTDVIDFYAAKISGSAGTVTWQQRLTGTDIQGANEWQRVTTDSSGNVFLNGYGHHSTAAPEDDLITAKYNSAGTLQWQRRINTGTSLEFGRGATMRANGSVIVAARSVGTSPQVGTLVNYDTNGNILWQRSFTNFQIYDVVVDSKDDMLVVGLLNQTHFCVFKLPSDGSKTGTYTLFGASTTYSASTGNAITSSFTAVTTPTITNATATNTTTTNTSATFSDLARTYTSTGIPT